MNSLHPPPKKPKRKLTWTFLNKFDVTCQVHSDVSCNSESSWDLRLILNKPFFERGGLEMGGWQPAGSRWKENGKCLWPWGRIMQEPGRGQRMWDAVQWLKTINLITTFILLLLIIYRQPVLRLVLWSGICKSWQKSSLRDFLRGSDIVWKSWSWLTRNIRPADALITETISLHRN